ncbi:DUF397 domain-containing protein [Streptomyces fradiae]|uniref:DUF397 domain-containing protein n=1 Tax=Streptomyces fradiae TaxID=1906 RepID=UPI0035BE46D4
MGGGAAPPLKGRGRGWGRGRVELSRSLGCVERLGLPGGGPGRHQPPGEPHWFKSSYSSGEGGECIEVRFAPDAVLVRDSKQATGPMLGVDADAWSAFLELAARG